MDVDAAFVSDGEPSEAVDPCEASFDDPSMATEFLRGVLASAGDARLDIPARAGIAAVSVIVGFVGVQLAWPAARAAGFAGDGGNGVDQLLERHAVVDISTGQQKCERDALCIRREVAFYARPASICWINPRRIAPFLAAMEEESTQARFQSMRPASRSRTADHLEPRS